ncbi:hypothetical protein AGMMS50268_26300 [Spirochaetia bacterium]|nr:hypothetical protein AGMMS50268_26300 [Spirochaetia bacterium]
MVYKQKRCLLSAVVGLLALVYALSFVFDPQQVDKRSDAFTWLDPRFLDQIDAVEIYGPAADTRLVRRNNAWFVSADGAEYPARQFRVEDFLGALTRRGVWPVQARSASAHERLGLAEAAASRIVVRGGAGLPLLDLLAGNGNLSGRGIYLRKAGQNEARSGEDRLSGYISGPRSSWYNLRLFPDSETGVNATASITVDSVQRLTVYPPAGRGMNGPAVFTRSGSGWSINGIALSQPENNKADTYIRGILNIEGEDFISPSAGPEAFDDGRLVLELGDGSIRTVRIGPPGESDQRCAVVSGSPYVYALTSWAVDRLFRDASFFD